MRFEQRLSLITLGVSDLTRSRAFYRDVLGWTPSSVGGDDVVFFPLNGIVLGLLPRAALAADAGVDALDGGAHDPGAPGVALSRVALAYNVRERAEVDQALAQVRDAGARVVKPAEDAPWGGRSGYFADPDGFLWEVAWNPGFRIHEDGSIEVPA
jgi:uncharacterized protein